MTDEKDKDIQKKLDQVFFKGLKEKKFPENFDQEFWERLDQEKLKPPVSMEKIPAVSMMAGIAGIMLMIIVFGFLVIQKPDEPVVDLIQGTVSRAIKGFEPKPLSKGNELKKGDHIVTGPSDWLIVELEDKYQVKLEPNSSVIINELKTKWFGKSVFRLTKGQVLVSIRSKKPYPFEVKTPNAYARAIGTQFAVQVSSFVKPVSWVGIVEGKVEVGKLDQLEKKGAGYDSNLSPFLTITAGNEVYISEEIDKPVGRQMIDAKREELAELFQFAKKNQLILLISMSENRVNELLAPALIFLTIDTKDQELKPVEHAANQIGQAIQQDDFYQREKAAAKFEEAIMSQTKLDQASGLLAAGAYYYFLKKYDESVRVFEDVIKQYPNSSLRSLALMAAAKIYHEQLNNSERALELTEEIITNYPKSYEAKPAERLRHSIMAA